jgi:hypothetical protein
MTSFIVPSGMYFWFGILPDLVWLGYRLSLDHLGLLLPHQLLFLFRLCRLSRAV